MIYCILNYFKIIYRFFVARSCLTVYFVITWQNMYKNLCLLNINSRVSSFVYIFPINEILPRNDCAYIVLYVFWRLVIRKNKIKQNCLKAKNDDYVLTWYVFRSLYRQFPKSVKKPRGNVKLFVLIIFFLKFVLLWVYIILCLTH